MKRFLLLFLTLCLLFCSSMPAYADGDPNIDTGGSGMGKTERILKACCAPDTKWVDGKRLSSRESATSVQKWIDSLNL